MKFLCLHGAIGNPENFAVQLDPLVKELNKDGVDFQFARGGVSVKPTGGFEEYFGPGPHWRFFDDMGMAEGALLDRVRDFPQLDTPEETLRSLLFQDTSVAIEMSTKLDRSPKKTLAPLYEILDNDPEIAGIIGYSEGAVVAGTLLLDEQRLEAAGSRKRQLKCAVFFAGWPPLSPEGNPVFADESDIQIEAHSVHVIGASDPYISGSMSLYNACDEDSAMMFDHGKGHTIPRDTRTLRELADTMRTMMNNAGIDTASSNSSEVDSVDYPSD